MIITVSKLNYEKNEEVKIEEALKNLNDKLETYNEKLVLSKHSFEIYFRSYAKLVGDKGIRDLESLFKYVTTSIYMDLASEHIVKNRLEIMDCLDDVMRNNDNFYTKLYKDIVTFGKDLYEEISGKPASKDFIKLDTKEMQSRASRISIFSNKNGVAAVFADPNGRYHSKDTQTKKTFTRSVCEDTLTLIDNMSESLEEKAKVNNLYNIALKYRTLKECQNEWWWPFKYLTRNYWDVRDKLNQIETKVRESKSNVFNSIVSKDDFIKYMAKEEQVEGLESLNSMFFADFNVVKINGIVYEAARADLESLYEKNINTKQINVNEVNHNQEIEREHVLSNSVDLDNIRREHLDLSNDESELDSSKKTIEIDEINQDKSYAESNSYNGMESMSQSSSEVNNEESEKSYSEDSFSK